MCIGVDDEDGCEPVLTEDIFEDSLEGVLDVWILEDLDFFFALIGCIERYGG